ncbi:hypothetical protein D3C81_08900 [compost metagenome]
MKIRMTLENLEKAMSSISAIIADKMAQEEVKNLILWVKEGKVKFVGANYYITNINNIDCELEQEEGSGESFISLRAKDINDIMATFKGLKKTKVEYVDFIIGENNAIMEIKEVPIDDKDEFAAKLNQVSKFKITRPRMKPILEKQIKEIDTTVEGTPIVCADLRLYIDALLPTIAKETRENVNHMLFGEDYIYTVLSTYVAIMKNELPKEQKSVISDFKLQNTIVNFLKGFMGNLETISIHKHKFETGKVVLTIIKDDAIAVISCADLQRTFDIKGYMELPQNKIAVDKLYLLDVLKRMNLSVEAAFVEVDLDGTEGNGYTPTMKVTSKNMTQEIPLRKAKGTGKYNFSMRAELLSSMVFGQTNLDENVFFSLDIKDNSVILACSDNTNIWATRMNGLAITKGNFDWH